MHMPKRCDVEVRESDLPRVLATIRALGFAAALGDLPPPGGPRSVAVWTVRCEGEAPVESEETVSLLETLTRALEDQALTYNLINTESVPPTPREWWTVRFSATGMPTGMRVRSGGAADLEVQLHALAQFLDVNRTALTATTDGPNAAPGTTGIAHE